jgi:hypothetical protein
VVLKFSCGWKCSTNTGNQHSVNLETGAGIEVD